MQAAKRARLQASVKIENESSSQSGDAPPAWKQWCRLCAKDDPEHNVSIYVNESETLDHTLVTAIGKYFWVTIRDKDNLPKYLCAECHTLLNWLTNFTERVNKVQAMYYMLQNSDLDPKVLRKQYGLMDATREHIVKSTEDPCSGVQIKILGSEGYDEDDEVDKDSQDYQLVLEALQEEVDEQMPEEVEQWAAEIEAEMQAKEENKELDLTMGDETETLHTAPTSVTEEEAEEFMVESASKRQEEPADLEGTGTEEEVDDSDLYKELEGSYKEGENTADHIADEQRLLKQHKKTTKRRRGRPSKYPELLQDVFPPDSDSDSNEPKYQCSVCSKNYKNPTSYRRHMLELHQTTPDIPDFKCEVCEKIYPTERQLKLHERTHLPLEEKLDVPCPYCDRKFTKTAVMRQHISGMHYNMKPYICDECGRALKTLAALNEHKLVHTNETPFTCEVCQKGFKNRARLKVHSEVHAGTSYVCTLCGLQLNTKRTLKMHMLVHSDQKRFKCDFCQAAFKRSKALKNHLILHTGMRPYTCNFCNKSFSNGSNCRAHKKKTHPQELAEEEAQGKKTEAVTVPKLEELRTNKFIVDNPRKVQRHSGGLTPHMRALLIAAEQRAKGTQSSKTDEGVSETDADGGDDSQMHSTLQYHDENDLRMHNNDLLDVDAANSLVDGEEDDDEDEEEETVIYEIIDEI